ncbi:MAG: ATP-dependent DNA helicase RecG [Candidatus Muiribacteriota bacterium]|jgi:ATP-dependent DNA helicase RecG
MNEFLNKDIQYIKGVGPKRVRLFNKLEIFNAGDLLGFIPTRYEDRRSVVTVKEGKIDENSLFLLKITDSRLISKGKFKILKLRACDTSGSYIDIVYFNQTYLKDKFKIGKNYYFYGKKKFDFGTFSLNSPDFESEDEKKTTGKLLPVYNLTAGLTQNVIRNTMSIILEQAEKEKFDEIIPDYIKKKYSIDDYFTSIKKVHFPINEEEINQSLKSLKWREIFILQTAFGIISQKKKIKNGLRIDCLKNFEIFQKNLPFTLTNAQKKVINEISDELNTGKNINRLLQGDVGSGKTVVVAFFLMSACMAGFKSIIMAPTEVLAAQHYNFLLKLLSSFKIEVVFLKGGNYKGKKKELEIIESEKPVVVCGTHALIQEKVKYGKTGIIIIDEQHRFGVKQRMELVKKTDCSNIIVMSATPIPRTLALTAYGDMDYSVIDEKPEQRKKIKTFVRGEKSLPDIFKFIKERLKSDEKAFIITPLIEESEKLDLKAAVKVWEELRTTFFKSDETGLLHGRMKTKEKEEVMEEFRNGKINVLVSTTVVEVGVDISMATVIVIKNAERFGLAQLHQLRGRVGRGDRQSYCVLVHSDNAGRQSVERLKLMEKTDDGFELSEHDLKLRGAGEFFGSRQHGFGNFKFIDVVNDRKIIETSKKEVEAMFKIYKFDNLPENMKNYVENNLLKNYQIL